MMLEIFDKAFRNVDGTGFRASQAVFSMTTGALVSPPMDYSDIGIAGTDVLDGSLPFYFKMSIHDAGHSPLDLTNDYSNAPPAIAACPQIVAYLDAGSGATVVAGTPP
jgi:hypothetical protein